MDNFKSSLRAEIEQALLKLTEREREILKLRYGLEDDHARTLKEVAHMFNTTREEIQRIEIEAIMKLKHPNHINKINKLYHCDEGTVQPPEPSEYQPRAEGVSLAELAKLYELVSPEERIFRSIFGERVRHPEYEHAAKLAEWRELIYGLMQRPEVRAQLTEPEARLLSRAFGLEDERIRTLRDLVLGEERPIEEVYLHLDDGLGKLLAFGPEELLDVRAQFAKECACYYPEAFWRAHRAEPVPRWQVSSAEGEVFGLARLGRPAIQFSHHFPPELGLYLTYERQGERLSIKEIASDEADARWAYLNFWIDRESARQLLEGRKVLLRNAFDNGRVLETAHLPRLSCFITYWSDEEWPILNDGVFAIVEDELSAREAHLRALREGDEARETYEDDEEFNGEEETLL